MGKKDKRVDAYILKAKPFARPILRHVRALVHKAVPGTEETIKWGFPHFEYKGMMCSMAGFLEHCAVGFWKSRQLPDPDGILEIGDGAGAMGNLGRITNRKDLPPDGVLLKYFKAARALNEEGVRGSARPRRSAAPLVVPAFFMNAVKKNAKALKMFQNFPPSHKREYVEWVSSAKTEETRERRLATAVEWMAEGKPQNWRYMARR